MRRPPIIMLAVALLGVSVLAYIGLVWPSAPTGTTGVFQYSRLSNAIVATIGLTNEDGRLTAYGHGGVKYRVEAVTKGAVTNYARNVAIAVDVDWPELRGGTVDVQLPYGTETWRCCVLYHAPSALSRLPTKKGWSFASTV